MSEEALVQKLKNTIRSFPDFPKNGILFWDVMPVLQDASLMHELCDFIAEKFRTLNLDAVAALEARGFLFGPQVAIKLGLPFVPIRKAGKLPGEVHTMEYSKEYGKDKLQIQKGILPPNAKVAIIDDLLATGGTLAAACQLIKNAGGSVDHCLCLIELKDLNGRKFLPETITFESILSL
uniref:Adenine phosphoribosyltransferase n=1 Tax=Romanomermis culicivorax TaxID=13658 RepID=A0A915HRG4_ROMCU